MKRVVVKIGSSVIAPQGLLNTKLLRRILGEINSLIDSSWSVFLVSSGAIAVGMHKLNISSRPQDMKSLQACASVGQVFLMDTYNRLMKPYGKVCAQILLTWDDFTNRRRYLNARNTLFSLCGFKVLPVINENDAISTEEIKFGDNDKLSSLVANLVDAQKLIILTDVDGFYFRGRKLDIVGDITPQMFKEAGPSSKDVSTGGMYSKLQACRIAQDSGIEVHIACAQEEGVLERIILEKENLGTVFIPRKKLKAKKRWIAFGSIPQGKIYVDQGAKKALIFSGKSLLSPGVVSLEGNFSCGDVVDILDEEGQIFARGRVSVESSYLRRMKGKKIGKEVVHRDNLVII